MQSVQSTDRHSMSACPRPPGAIAAVYARDTSLTAQSRICPFADEESVGSSARGGGSIVLDVGCTSLNGARACVPDAATVFRPRLTGHACLSLSARSTSRSRQESGRVPHLERQGDIQIRRSVELASSCIPLTGKRGDCTLFEERKGPTSW